MKAHEIELEKSKKTIEAFKMRIKVITQQMDQTSATNAKIMRQMATEAGIAEMKSTATQTNKNLLTLTYLKKINPEDYGHLEDICYPSWEN